MKVANITATDLADPRSEAWSGVGAEAVNLAAVPLEAQPTEYIREAWKSRPYGQAAGAKVAAASDGQRLYLRLEWEDDPAPNAEFPDAVGAIFPTDGAGSLATMGNPSQPVTIWYWASTRPAPLQLSSRGPGLVSKQDAAGVAAAGALADGRWSVVLSGPVSAAAPDKLGVAVWNGSNEERAGLAAVSCDWLPLEFAQGEDR
jgi:DMSO reductase family type II enzyme heme b subunit